jgi:hypothetical protein
MNARDVMKYGHLTVLKAIDGFTDDNWNEGGVCGVWSTRNIIAHLASYELLLGDVLQNAADGSGTPNLDHYLETGEAFNDEEVDRRSGMTVAETLREYVAAYERSADAASQIPDGLWTTPGTLPWYGAEYSIDDWIVYQFYGHKREHTAQIDVYRDHLSAVTSPAGKAVN